MTGNALALPRDDLLGPSDVGAAVALEMVQHRRGRQAGTRSMCGRVFPLPPPPSGCLEADHPVVRPRARLRSGRRAFTLTTAKLKGGAATAADGGVAKMGASRSDPRPGDARSRGHRSGDRRQRRHRAALDHPGARDRRAVPPAARSPRRHRGPARAPSMREQDAYGSRDHAFFFVSQPPLLRPAQALEPT